MNPMESVQLNVHKFIELVKNERTSSIGSVASLPGQWLNENNKNLCIKLLKEEYKELMEAIDQDDWPEIIDGAADLIFVTLYAMARSGIMLDAYWQEVCWTNLQKKGGPKDPVTGKQLKPEGWKPPRIREMLDKNRAIHNKLESLGVLKEYSKVTVHSLKTWGPSYQAIATGTKNFDCRRQPEDGFFLVGDILRLQEFGDDRGKCVDCHGRGFIEHIDSSIIKFPENKRCLLCAESGKGRYSGNELICEVTFAMNDAQMSLYYPELSTPLDSQWVVLNIKVLSEFRLE